MIPTPWFGYTTLSPIWKLKLRLLMKGTRVWGTTEGTFSLYVQNVDKINWYFGLRALGPASLGGPGNPQPARPRHIGTPTNPRSLNLQGVGSCRQRYHWQPHCA